MQRPPQMRTLALVIIGDKDSKSIRLPITAGAGQQAIDIRCLIDSGAGETIIHPRVVRKLNLSTTRLDTPIIFHNVDGTTNKTGMATRQATFPISIKGIKRHLTAVVGDIGHEDLLLGFPWLDKENPDIDWHAGTIELSRFRSPIYRLAALKAAKLAKLAAQQTKESDNPAVRGMSKFIRNWVSTPKLPQTSPVQPPTDEHTDIWLNAVEQSADNNTSLRDMRHDLQLPQEGQPVTVNKVTTATELAQAKEAAKPVKTTAEMVPEYLHDYLSVFDKQTASCLPEHTSYDHEITLKPDRKSVV